LADERRNVPTQEEQFDPFTARDAARASAGSQLAADVDS
jgi:hypothetical protein